MKFGLIGLLLLSCVPCRELSVVDICERQTATVPTKKWGVYDTLPATILGRKGNVIIDTGATGSVFSSSWLGYPDRSIVQDFGPVVIAGIRIQLMSAYLANSPFSSSETPNGLLGTDILEGLDWRTEQRKTTLSANNIHCRGRIIKLRNGGSLRPYIDSAILGGLRVSAMLDTGAARVLLSDATANLLQSRITDSRAASYCDFDGCYASGAFEGVLDEVCVGDVCEQNVPVKWPAWDAIGLSWLQRHPYIISLRRMELEVCGAD